MNRSPTGELVRVINHKFRLAGRREVTHTNRLATLPTNGMMDG